MKMHTRFKSWIPVILILIVQTCFSVLKAQTIPFQYINSVKTSPKSFVIDKESRPAQSMVVFGEKAEVEKEWKRYTKKEFKISWKEKRGILLCNAMNIPSISLTSINLFYKVEARENETEIIFSVQFSDGQFVDPGNFQRESKATGKILNDFAHEYYLKIIERDLVDFSQQIKLLNRDLKKNISAREELEKAVIKDSKTLSDQQQSVVESRERIEREEAGILKMDKNISKSLDKNEGDAEKNTKYSLKKEESGQSIANYEATIHVGETKINQLVSDIENYNLQKQDIEIEILQKQALLAELSTIKYTLENYKGLLRDKVQ